MAIEPIKGFYVHDEATDTDGVAKIAPEAIDGEIVDEGARGQIVGLATTQKLTWFNETVSGTAMVEVQVSLDAGTYDVEVDNVTSTDTDVSYSRINFYNGSTNLTGEAFYRGRSGKATITLSDHCDKLYFYAGSNWSTSQGDTFEFSNCKISQDTNLNEKITDVESEIDSVSNKMDSIYVPFEITETAGYYSDNGNINPASTSTKEVYTNKLPVEAGDMIFWEFDTKQATFSNLLWIAYMAYDINENVVGSRNTLNNAVATRADGVITIPAGVAYISFTYRTYGIDGFNASKFFMHDSIKEGAIVPYAFPFSFDKFYGHLFVHYVSWGSRVPEIPCQSIFDVQATAKLGFKYIEANVHATATSGKYVVTHGISGKLGQDFQTLSGEDVPDVVIANTSFNDLRANYRYKSKYQKYRVPITSLEEFLYQCKACNVFPLLQYVDETELEIAKGIVGNNMILYAGNRQVWDGYIMGYANYTTEAQILSMCAEIGAPFMYCMGNPTAFTDEQLKSIIAKVHKMGCYIGNAGNYDGLVENVRLLNLGFDFSASGSMVNNFESGNIIDICNNPTFSEITHNGTVSNGQLDLLENQKIEFTSNDNSFLKKYILDITYVGSLTIEFPQFVDGNETTFKTFSSDGSQSQRLSGTLVNRPLVLNIWAETGGATIKDISFKMSKC